MDQILLNYSFSVVSKYDLALANAFFLNSHIGAAIYIYYRQHMKKVSCKTRVMYSVYTAVLFNFGSVLLWATTKTVLPNTPVVGGLFGAFTSFCLLAVGREYLNFIDSLVSEDSE